MWISRERIQGELWHICARGRLLRNLDSYVTQKALDGLFVMIAEQEKSIRQDPVGTGSKLLQTVFGAVGK